MWHMGGIDENALNNVDKLTVWRLGLKGGQPSSHCVLVLNRSDCVQFDPEREDFMDYVNQIGDISSEDKWTKGKTSSKTCPVNIKKI